MTDDWVTAPAGHGAPASSSNDDWVTHNPPVAGSKENPLDDTEHAASAATIARVSLAPDEKVQLQRYAEAFKQPITDFGVIDGHVVRKVPGTDQFARVQPSVRGATGPLDMAKRAADWVAGGAGPAIPAITSTAGAAAAAILATPETLGAGAVPAAMAGGAGGAALGETARQKLDAALAPKGSEAPMDYGNMGWQAAAGAAGPLVGKAVEAMAGRVSPVVWSMLADELPEAGTSAAATAGRAAMTEGNAPVVKDITKNLGLSQAGLAALKRQAESHRTDLEQLTQDLAMLSDIGTPVDLSIGQKTGSVVAQQKERQMLRDPETAQDVVDLRNAQNDKQIPGAVRNVLDHVAPKTGQEEGIQTFRAGADAVMDAAKQARNDVAQPLYKGAFKANPSMQSAKLDELLDTPEGKDAFKYAITRMQNRMRNAAGPPDPELTEQMRLLVARGEMKAVPGGVSPGLKLETLDLIKQGLWDAEDALRKRVISGYARQGEVDEISSIRRAFTNELDKLDSTAAGATTNELPAADMLAAINKAGKLPPKQADEILSHAADMIREAGGVVEARDSYVFPKGQEDWYNAAFNAAEKQPAKATGIGVVKKPTEFFYIPGSNLNKVEVAVNPTIGEAIKLARGSDYKGLRTMGINGNVYAWSGDDLLHTEVFDSLLNAGKIPKGTNIKEAVSDAYDIVKGKLTPYVADNGEINRPIEKVLGKVTVNKAPQAPGIGHNSGESAGGLYKQARQAFGDPSEDIDAMKKGGIGLLQRMMGQDRQNMVNRIFEGGNILPEEVARMREQFAVAGKLDDWNIGLRSFVESKLSAALKTTNGEANNVGNKLYQSLFSDEQQKVMRAALGGDNAVMKRWDALGRVMRAAAHQLGEGSASVTDLQAPSALKRIGLGLKLILSPQGIPGEVLDKMAVSEKEGAARQFAKYALTPEGDKILKALYLQTPSSPKALSLLDKMLIQAGVVTGAGAVAQEPRRSVEIKSAP